MPTWGTVLSPSQIADLLALIDQWRLAPPATPTPAASPTPEPTTEAGVEPPARPSNPGGPGQAVQLTGDATAGAQVYTSNCQKCHGEQGKGGVVNPGSTDGTIPPLNPIDPTLVDKDSKTFAFNLDLFIEHGSTPEGSNPQQTMPAWGDDKKLTPQQIADVIAYLIALNPAP
jgi:mono/diheme cytochrome c family protein